MGQLLKETQKGQADANCTALCRSWVEPNVKTFLGEKKENWNMDKAADIKEVLLKVYWAQY